MFGRRRLVTDGHPPASLTGSCCDPLGNVTTKGNPRVGSALNVSCCHKGFALLTDVIQQAVLRGGRARRSGIGVDCLARLKKKVEKMVERGTADRESAPGGSGWPPHISARGHSAYFSATVTAGPEDGPARGCIAYAIACAEQAGAASGALPAAA